MAKGMNVECSRCGAGYNIYDDIQTKAVGICPTCNNVEGFKFEHPFTFEYNTGNVPAHLEDEDGFEWDWRNYDRGNRIDPDHRKMADTLRRSEVANAFDQDQDFIDANMGWD